MRWVGARELVALLRAHEAIDVRGGDLRLPAGGEAVLVDQRGRHPVPSRLARGAMTRVAVYSDFPYRRHEGEIVSDESFVLFLGPLAERLDRVVALGRLDPVEGPAHHRLPEEVDFAALPHYPALSGVRGRAGRRAGVAAAPSSGSSAGWTRCG